MERMVLWGKVLLFLCVLHLLFGVFVQRGVRAPDLSKGRVDCSQICIGI